LRNINDLCCREKNPAEPTVIQTRIIFVLLPDPQKVGIIIKQTYAFEKHWKEKYQLTEPGMVESGLKRHGE
jgi:hypothetical protein